MCFFVCGCMALSLWREFLGTFILYKLKTILVSDQRLKLDSSDICRVIDSYQPSSKTKWANGAHIVQQEVKVTQYAENEAIGEE